MIDHNTNNITTRLARAEDQEFLYRVYYSTREEELKQTNWTPEQKEAFVHQQFTAQTHHYQTNYPGALFQVIEVGGQTSSPQESLRLVDSSSPQPSPPSDGGEGEKVAAPRQAAGRLFVHARPTEIRIMDIALLPAFRGRGIGTFLLGKILAEGKEQQKAVTIHVEVFNPAMRLYERLGFKQMARTDVYWLMEWKLI